LQFEILVKDVLEAVLEFLVIPFLPLDLVAFDVLVEFVTFELAVLVVLAVLAFEVLELVL